jgi:hypothetical protein
MFAKVYEQRDPVPACTFRLGADTHTEYATNLVEVGAVAGDHAECWKLAKVMAAFPVLEFDSQLKQLN